MLSQIFNVTIPAKPFEYVQMIQNFENHPKNSYKDLEEGMKIFVIQKKAVERTSGHLIGVHFINNILFLDYDNKYLICSKLEEETKEFLRQGGSFILAYYYNKTIEYAQRIAV